jgi:hypothetical protein
MEREPDGELRFYWPNGRAFPAVPQPPPVPADPVTVLRGRHEAAGSDSIRPRRRRTGSASGSTWGGRSTSCIRWRDDRRR